MTLIPKPPNLLDTALQRMMDAVHRFEGTVNDVAVQRYLTSIERAYYRALTILTKLQKERRKEEQAAALERTWLAQVAQQTAESKERSNELGSFRQDADVPPNGIATQSSTGGGGLQPNAA